MNHEFSEVHSVIIALIIFKFFSSGIETIWTIRVAVISSGKLVT